MEHMIPSHQYLALLYQQLSFELMYISNLTAYLPKVCISCLEMSVFLGAKRSGVYICYGSFLQRVFTSTHQTSSDCLSHLTHTPISPLSGSTYHCFMYTCHLALVPSMTVTQKKNSLLMIDFCLPLPAWLPTQNYSNTPYKQFLSA